MSSARTVDYNVIVVGAGAAGVGVGVALKHAGIENFCIPCRSIIVAALRCMASAFSTEMTCAVESLSGDMVSSRDLLTIPICIAHLGQAKICQRLIVRRLTRRHRARCYCWGW